MVVLAVECLEEAREIDPALRARLDSLLFKGIEDENASERKLICEVLLGLRLKRMVRIDDNTYVDPTYVTHAEYQLFLDEVPDDEGYYHPPHWLQETFPKGQGATPVVGVLPEGAVAFCKWLTQRQMMPGWTFRLPHRGELANYKVTERSGECRLLGAAKRRSRFGRYKIEFEKADNSSALFD